MTMVPDPRSMGRYFARSDLIEQIIACGHKDDADNYLLDLRLSGMSDYELYEYGQSIGVGSDRVADLANEQLLGERGRSMT